MFRFVNYFVSVTVNQCFLDEESAAFATLRGNWGETWGY